MPLKTKFLLPILSCAALIPFSNAMAWDDLPPQSSKPLSGILQAVEQKNPGRIVDVSYDDDGYWKVEICQTAQPCQKLYLDPATGAEKYRKTESRENDLPPANAKPASELARNIESREKGQISDMEFDYGRWKVELHRDNRKHKLYLNASNGKILYRR